MIAETHLSSLEMYKIRTVYQQKRSRERVKSENLLPSFLGFGSLCNSCKPCHIFTSSSWMKFLSIGSMYMYFQHAYLFVQDNHHFTVFSNLNSIIHFPLMGVYMYAMYGYANLLCRQWSLMVENQKLWFSLVLSSVYITGLHIHRVYTTTVH